MIKNISSMQIIWGLLKLAKKIISKMLTEINIYKNSASCQGNISHFNLVSLDVLK